MYGTAFTHFSKEFNSKCLNMVQKNKYWCAPRAHLWSVCIYGLRALRCYVVAGAAAWTCVRARGNSQKSISSHE